MKVLSLFDGVGGGYQALRLAGVQVSSYISSEIEKSSINIAARHIPDYLNLGDVRGVRGGNYDLILAGSPCQGFSYAGRGLNFSDPRSSLFFEFVRIVRESLIFNPDVKIFLENVNMRREWKDVITSELGITPVEICASTLSPFRRNRLYWFNWESAPEIKTVSFKELTGGLPCSIVGRPLDENLKRVDGKGLPVVQCIEVTNGDIGRCVTTVSKDSCVYLGANRPQSRIPDAYGANRNLWRDLTISELEVGHGYDSGFFDNVKESTARKAIGNGWSLQVVSSIFRGLNHV
ncbi:DNA (cytosine-5-)-methyltransferase [Salmonella phage vB Seyj3-1]|nr:DNA (cytosine-5-)-methyltransferase [Salmonella phage vB Seyj3-1]